MSDADSIPQAPSVADVLGRGFSLPLVFLVALIGAGVGYARFQANKTGIEVRDPEDLPPPRIPQDPGGSGSEVGGGVGQGDTTPTATVREVEEALALGDYSSALDLAGKLGNPVYVERANLYHTLTRAIQPSAFAKADSIAKVTGPKGPITGLVETTDAGARIKQIDGRESPVSPAALAARTELRGAAKVKALTAQLDAARDALGVEAGGLALHRLAYLAFSAGLNEVGGRYLSEALKGHEGSILVDMFGEGDFDRLHAAQRLLAGKAPITVASADPIPPPPSHEDPPLNDPEPEPTRTTTTVRVNGQDVTRTTGPKRNGRDPMTNESAWQRADKAYRSGLKLYRGTFGLSNRMATISIRAALKEFQRAQTALDPLSARYPKNLELENRQQELAQLVIDCMRRQRIGD